MSSVFETEASGVSTTFLPCSLRSPIDRNIFFLEINVTVVFLSFVVSLTLTAIEQ